MLFVNVRFLSFFYPPSAFVLGDVSCKNNPVRRTCAAGLVISPPDEIFLYTAGDVHRQGRSSGS